MGPDVQVIAGKLAVIEESLGFLEEMGQLEAVAFAADRRNVRATERYFQLACEAVFDIGSHLVASQALERPSRYADIVPILRDVGALQPDTATRLTDLAGFRNILVHDYGRVEPVRLHTFCRTRLDDFRSFSRDVAEYVARSSS